MEKHFQIAEFPPHPFPEETPSPADPRPWGEPGARRQCVEEANKWGESAQGRRVSLPEVSVSTFRSRTRSEPANFTYALQYGRELRRMSDEFVSTFTDSKVVYDWEEHVENHWTTGMFAGGIQWIRQPQNPLFLSIQNVWVLKQV
ncbi:uncharacterized protein [Narcine bancroftii]|uniref:uncharacterized protein isoform X1 n=1 Tax=Narcine bancroftii TaxID=1343680 RepID=UPI0038313691